MEKLRKNKEKFIDEISSLVEKDIINGNTLKDNIESDDFKEALRKVCYDFLINIFLKILKVKE